MHSLLRGLIFGSIFCLLSFVGASADDQEKENALPGIWSAINESKQYHVMFQVQMLNSSQRLTVEEWASFKAGLHRLDLISHSGRTTYLTNAKTGEVFMYRPYSCKLLAKDASELETIANLFRGHPLIMTRNGDGEAETIAHGLGPLWLSAKAEASSVVELPRIQNRNIRVYSVEFKKGNKDFDYTLRFFFNGDYKFVDAIEWISGAARSRKVLVQVRAKVIQMAGNELIEDEIFDLPVGYGCIRSPKYEHPFQVNLGQHRHGVKFLHEGAPNRALLEVALSYPRDATHHSWQTNRYSLSLWRANMKLNELKRSYYVSQVKYRDSASGELVRQRKVWSDTSDSKAAAILYKINPDSGECRVAHVSSAERLRLDFPTSQRDQPAPILISMDLLDWLFNNWEGFHLIREKPSIVSTVLREATYELKMNELRLDAVSKIPIWSGPVSVLKEVSLMPQYVEDPFSKHDDIDLFTSYYTKVTILFYSDDSAQVKYKISLTLFESDDIDLSHIQRQLDISTCIAEQRSETILVKYPIETEEIRARLLESRDVFLKSFCANLFSTTPIDPMNANGFEVTFDRFNMLIKFNLLDVPLWQSFQMRTGLSLKRSSVLQEKLTSSLESCAESCGHHNCLHFAFSEKLKRCQLEIGLELGPIETEPSENFVLFESPKLAMSEPWIKLDPNGGKKHLRPHELLDILRRFVLFFTGDTQEDKKAIEAAASIPLTIKIDQRRDIAKESNNLQQFNFLRPIEVHSSLDDMKEIVRISSATSDEDNKSELVFVRDASKLHAEYSVLLVDRILSKADKTDEEFTVSSYNECAAYCDNFNCRSFSYCETSNICIVSKISDRDALERSSRTAFTCTVSVLDYLSKFEPFGLAPAPAKAKKALEGLTELACAQTCVETGDINCQAFYFCAASRSARSKPQVSKCYLEDRHVHDINPLGLDAIAAYQLETGASETKNSSAAGGSKMQQSCNFYSRSYLAQFDQFAGKSLDNLKQQQSMSLLVESSSHSSGPDACARDCVARSCVAFDVCLAEPGQQQASARGENRLQVCRLALHSIKSGDLSSERRGCSTFVLSDHSQFRSPNTTILDWKAQGSQIARNSKVFEALAAKRPSASAGGAPPGEGEIVVDATQKEAEEGDIMRGLMEILSASSAIGEQRSIVGGSHWFSRLISVLFGTFLGVSCAILWFSRQSQASEQFQWRRFTFGR